MLNFLRCAHKAISIFIVLMMMTSGLGAPTASAKIEEASITPSSQDRTIEAIAAPLGINLIQDPSFEGSYGSSTGPWFQTPFDTICWSGTGLCDVNGAGYHSGGAWAGFGPQQNSFGDIHQDVVFPRCGAQLEFYLYLGQSIAGWGMNNYFFASIDGIEVFRVLGSQIGSYSIYTKVSIPVNQFADGGKHRIRFYGELVENFLYFNLDDVALYSTLTPGCAAIAVQTSNTALGTYAVPGNGGERLSFPVDSGPMFVAGAGNNNVDFVASQRFIQKGTSTPLHFSEMMGLPDNLKSTRYVFPAYDSLFFNSQLRIANVGTANTTVTVRVGGALKGSYPLGPKQGAKISYAGLSGGPVVVQSSNSSVPIIASLRVATIPYNGSYSEMIGLPQSLVDTGYIFPWYNNIAPLDTQLRVGNVGAAPTTVTVRVGTTVVGTIPLLVNESKRVSFPNVSNGPMKVTSSNNVPIVASLRVAFRNGSTFTSFSEVMGLPQSQQDTIFLFPWYNNQALDSQLRFANISSVNATVRIYIGGVQMPGSPFTLPVGVSTRQSFNVNNGPVRIVSNQPIVASLRVVFKNGNTFTSFSEMMGLPQKQLTNKYIFPWYNNLAPLDTQLRLGVP